MASVADPPEGLSPGTPEDAIEAALVGLVRRTTDPRGNRKLNERAGVDFDRSSWILLLRIAENEPVRLSEIADAIGIDASTASRQVARLVDAGVVERRPDPADGRALLHQLTTSGRAVLDRMRTARREWVADLLAPFDAADRRRLAALLTRLVDSVDALHEAESGSR